MNRKDVSLLKEPDFISGSEAILEVNSIEQSSSYSQMLKRVQHDTLLLGTFVWYKPSTLGHVIEAQRLGVKYLPIVNCSSS